MSGMSFEIAVMSRRSIRGFQDTEVPQDVLNKVFDIARWAPSNTNIQPWQTYVASGATRDALREKMMAAVKNGSPPNHDHKEPRRPIGQIWKDRRRECAAVLYHAMDISWEDKEARSAASFRNFELFDAPHVAFLCIDEAFGLSQAWDIGMYAQTLMLAMTANGLASCAQGTMGHHPEMVRDAFDLGPEVKVLFGLSFGYEDSSMKVNSAHTQRAALEDTVTFKC